MKFVDIENWERKDHFNYFRQFDYPQLNICANVDITEFYRFIKENGYTFFISFLFAATKTANSVKEFRYRIRGDKIVEYEIVNPSFTVLNSNNAFGYCRIGFLDQFKEFFANASNEMERTRNHADIEDEPGRDDLLYITSIPWVSFTSFTHPIKIDPADSIPRISWGKYFEENGKIKIPLSVQLNHALADGVHVGQYFSTIQEILNNPAKYLKV
jgi:chloramphenicol O-acetyltransferase type A